MQRGKPVSLQFKIRAGMHAREHVRTHAHMEARTNERAKDEPTHRHTHSSLPTSGDQPPIPPSAPICGSNAATTQPCLPNYRPRLVRPPPRAAASQRTVTSPTSAQTTNRRLGLTHSTHQNSPRQSILTGLFSVPEDFGTCGGLPFPRSTRTSPARRS